MTIMTRRNAFVGWLVLRARKRSARRKMGDAVPDARTGGAAAGALAALAALVVLRRRRGGSNGEVE